MHARLWHDRYSSSSSGSSAQTLSMLYVRYGQITIATVEFQFLHNPNSDHAMRVFLDRATLLGTHHQGEKRKDPKEESSCIDTSPMFCSAVLDMYIPIMQCQFLDERRFSNAAHH